MHSESMEIVEPDSQDPVALSLTLLNLFAYGLFDLRMLREKSKLWKLTLDIVGHSPILVDLCSAVPDRTRIVNLALSSYLEPVGSWPLRNGYVLLFLAYCTWKSFFFVARNALRVALE